MDNNPFLDGEPRPSAGDRSLSRVSTATSATLMVHTPHLSDSDSISSEPVRIPTPVAIPSGPLLVTSLSVTDWRQPYPRLGQFAMTPSEEVVAASLDGLVYFRRVQDHRSKPWSEPRPLPQTTARLDASTVTGLALHQEQKGTLHVYCIAAGKVHAFYRSGDLSSSFVVDPCHPFEGFKASGTPAVTSIRHRYDDQDWCIVAPCRSGGILYSSTTPAKSSSSGLSKQYWETTIQVATHLGIVSAASVAATRVRKLGSCSIHADSSTTNIVAVCIANSRLHTIEGPFDKRSYSRPNSWQGGKSTRIQHPGEVTGNPVLLSSLKSGDHDYQLNMLVPSAEGGVYHFIRTVETPDEWHMIGRISFPTGVPIASSLACARLTAYIHFNSFRAFVQCGGRLYLIETDECAEPWAGSQLYPIEGPGPFLH